MLSGPGKGHHGHSLNSYRIVKMDPGEDGGAVQPDAVMDRGGPQQERGLEPANAVVRGGRDDDHGDDGIGRREDGGGQHVAAPANGTEAAQEDKQHDVAVAAADAAAAAAVQNEELKRQVEEWLDRNQFGLLWEAMALINVVLCYKRPSMTQMSQHKAFHFLYFAFAILKGALLGYFGASPAILLNRVIGTSRLRQVLWFFWCFTCYAVENHFDWETHVQTYCTEPRYPLLCLPLAVVPFSLLTFSVGYDVVSMFLFPLRAIHNYQHATATGAQDRDAAARELAARTHLHVAAAGALYIYCAWVVAKRGPASATLSNHTVRTIHGVGRGVGWLFLAVLIFFFTALSILRAMRLAIIFIRRRRPRRWGRIWRGLGPHAHVD